MDAHRTAKMLSYLRNLYPRFDPSEEATALWVREMHNVDPRIAQKAVLACYQEDSAKITLSMLRAKLVGMKGYRTNNEPQSREDIDRQLARIGLRLVPQGTGWNSQKKCYEKVDKATDSRPTIEYVMDVLGAKYVTERLEALVGKAGTVKMSEILTIPDFKAKYAALLAELHQEAVERSSQGRGDSEYRKLWGQGKLLFEADRPDYRLKERRDCDDSTPF